MNYKYILSLLLIAVTLGGATTVQAQSELQKGNRHYNNYDFALALAEYKKAAAKRNPDLQTAERIANAYRLTQQSEEAENWYEKVVAMEGRDPMNLYYYAEALRSNGKYELAKEQYKRLAEEMPQMADRARALITASDEAKRWQAQPPVAGVTRVAELSGDGYSDFSPMPYRQGIVFSSDRGGNTKKEEVFGWTGRPYLKLYTAEKNSEGIWSSPAALPASINTTYHNATASALENGRELYFTRTKLVKKQQLKNPDPTSWVREKEDNKEYVNRLEIFVAKKAGDDWDVQPFAYNNVEEYSVGHPALSPDGKTLYFVSDMPGGTGESDIYYSVRRADGKWEKPVNAGNKINTPWRESFPYVDANGTLYFASEGHTGMGGLDIFKAEGQHAAWTAVRNMGYPINSPKNDFGIMFDSVGVSGLLSSNRDAANGTDDIFAFTMVGQPLVFEVTTLERVQNEQKRNENVPLGGVRVVVTEKYTANDSTVFLTNEAGKYFLDGRKGYSYTFVGTKEGYLKQSEQIEVSPTAPDTVQVRLIFDRSTPRQPIVLENIYYDFDKWNIRPDAAKELDKLARVLKNNPGIKIELSSHTDSRGSHNYNQRLSDRRAKSAVDYLVSKGISSDRLTAKGYGEEKLLNKCADDVKCSEEEHQLNRRTEFMIE